MAPPLGPSSPALSPPGKSKEAEIKRINKELANIRSKFKGRLGAHTPGSAGGAGPGAGMAGTWRCDPSPLASPFLLPLAPGDKALDGYSKKKYVCKLLFIFLLGHDIDFGHMEAVNLLSSNRYTEKQIVSGGRGARPCPRGPLRRGRFFLAFFLSL